MNKQTTHYGFVSTGNLNESTAKIYGDHCLLTSDRNIMADVNRIFHYLEQPKTRMKFLRSCKKLMVSPVQMRKQILMLGTMKSICRRLLRFRGHWRRGATARQKPEAAHTVMWLFIIWNHRRVNAGVILHRRAGAILHQS